MALSFGFDQDCFGYLPQRGDVVRGVQRTTGGKGILDSVFARDKTPKRRRKIFLAPFMIHEGLPTLTETAFGSHPCCVVSVTYVRTYYFHGANEGSNPSGDANYINGLSVRRQLLLPWFGLLILLIASSN